jgi:hypothetical protein
MAAVFANMPDKLIPQLESAWRKDLVELYRSGKEARLENMMHGFSVLKKLTSGYLLLQTTECSTVEMKLLPLVNNTHVLCMVTTVNGPVPDSRIAFFSTAWETLDTGDLFTPVPVARFIKEDADTDSEGCPDALFRLDMELIHYQLHPDTPTLTATFTTPLYLNEGEREKVAPYIKEPKVYTWEKYHFE